MRRTRLMSKDKDLNLPEKIMLQEMLTRRELKKITIKLETL